MKKFLILSTLFLVSILSYSQAGNCPGLCITANGSYAAVNGFTPELNTSNRGCLTAGEASSSFWFQVCFTSNGTFQFYIDPSGNRNDFDFAIWNNTTCPPTTSPIRCSWAAVPPGGPCATCDYTGLGNGAIDLSESASGNGWVSPMTVTTGQCITININNYGSGSNNFTINLGGTTAGMTCAVLPVELVSFEGYNDKTYNTLNWVCATETNNNFFTIESSIDNIDWVVLTTVGGAGTSNINTFYSYKDFSYTKDTYNYYRLKQTDFNGDYKYSDIIYVDNRNLEKSTLVKTINQFGQEVGDNYRGFVIEIYEDGSTRKIIRQ